MKENYEGKFELKLENNRKMNKIRFGCAIEVPGFLSRRIHRSLDGKKCSERDSGDFGTVVSPFRGFRLTKTSSGPRG